MALRNNPTDGNEWVQPTIMKFDSEKQIFEQSKFYINETLQRLGIDKESIDFLTSHPTRNEAIKNNTERRDFRYEWAEHTADDPFFDKVTYDMHQKPNNRRHPIFKMYALKNNGIDPEKRLRKEKAENTRLTKYTTLITNNLVPIIKYMALDMKKIKKINWPYPTVANMLLFVTYFHHLNLKLEGKDWWQTYRDHLIENRKEIKEILETDIDAQIAKNNADKEKAQATWKNYFEYLGDFSENLQELLTELQIRDIDEQ